MADLYGNNESEDMSSFLQILMHNSSSSTSAPPPTNVAAGSAPAANFFGGVAAESSSSINFSGSGGFFGNDGFDPSSGINNLAGSEAFDRSLHQAQRSSKRTRAAEVHNMTEKRRRSRINEKLKALQTLIPNSNKTDKASMLDEAIEYLKQLQLQVQMLTMRNGMNTNPAYSMGPVQPFLVPQTGPELAEGNASLSANRGTELLSRNHGPFIQSALGTSNPGSSAQPMFPPPMAVATNSEILPSFVPSTQNQYGLLNHLAASKDICRDETLSRLQLDRSYSGNNSSPGVSSSS